MRKFISIISLFALLPFLTLGDIFPNSLPTEHPIAQREISLSNRQPDSWVNDVFKDNILLNLAYLKNPQHTNKPNWDEVRQSFQFEFKLEPGQTFAYHEDVLPRYLGKVTQTTNAHFNAQEGFRTDGYLFGDGVCHLASLINWVAKDAGLEVAAPNNHDFAKIADIPKEYGVSIYNYPGRTASNAQENLYITNNKNKPVSFKFEYNGEKVKISVLEYN